MLKLDGVTLRAVAVHGLTEEALHRRFPLAGHPRLATLMARTGLHRFPPDCGLPDPYDGLIDHPQSHADALLPVHDCMGAPLFVRGKAWGVVTFDALTPGAFGAVDESLMAETLSGLAGQVEALASVHMASDETGQPRTRSSPRSASRPVATIVRETRQPEGRSPAWQQLMQEVDTVAPSDLTVLILGETGTGKELVAHRLHEGSRRSQHPLVQVNCAALPETLADSELFGHRRGAFTGATQDRMGKFELAAGGTLMLDEVGELQLPVQAKLLRVLQSGDIQRPGSDAPLRVDVRVVAATNRDLRAEVAAGRFRADLYHRLAVYPVHVPPLRMRGRDVLALAGVFLEENQHRLGARNLRLSPASRDALLHHDWPGNVRELEHLISRAALRAWAEARGRAQRWTPIEPEHLGLWPGASRVSSALTPEVAGAVNVSAPGPTEDLIGKALNADLSPHAERNSGRETPQSITGDATRSSSQPLAHPVAHPVWQPVSQPSQPSQPRAPTTLAPTTLAPTLREATEAFQRQWLEALLRRHPHSMASAAREAGMDRSNFHRLIKKWGLSGDRR